MSRVIVTDNFNRSDGGLGSNWTTQSDFTALAIVSNACKASAAGDCGAVYTGAGALYVNQYAQAVMSTEADDGGPTVRGDTTGTKYDLVANAGANTTAYKVIGGTFTGLSTVAINWVATDTVYLEVQGTTIVSKQNGTTRHNFSDSAIDGVTVGGGYPGLHLFDTTIVYDSFEAGDFATAALTGTITASITETDIVNGGKTIILTLTGDSWIPA